MKHVSVEHHHHCHPFLFNTPTTQCGNVTCCKGKNSPNNSTTGSDSLMVLRRVWNYPQITLVWQPQRIEVQFSRSPFPGTSQMKSRLFAVVRAVHCMLAC